MATIFRLKEDSWRVGIVNVMEWEVVTPINQFSCKDARKASKASVYREQLDRCSVGICRPLLRIYIISDPLGSVVERK